MKKMKVGIIGTGFMGPVHIEAIRRLGNIKVEALAEANKDLAEKKAKELNIPNFYGDYKKLLEDESIEVIHNCTPNFMHYEVNKAAIKANKHVVSEKPLSLNTEESQELLKLAENNDIYHTVNFNYRQYPMVQQIKSVLENNSEKINLIQGHFLQDWMLYDTDYNWRVDPDKGGKSRAIADIGSHWCDLAQYITGLEIKKVLGHTKIVHPTRKKPKRKVETFEKNENIEFEEVKVETEDYAAVLLEFENNVIGHFTVSQVSPGHKNDLFIEINGEDKSYSWSQEKGNELIIGHRNKANEIMIKDTELLTDQASKYSYYPQGHIEGWSEGVKNMVKNFYDCVRNNGEASEYSFASFKDGHQEMKITEAILESVKHNKWIKIR